jgi:hypothetical protein
MLTTEQLRAVHGATSVAMAYGFKVEVEPHGLMRFRKGRDSGTCEVRDRPHARTAHLASWRTGSRDALNELRDALRAA